MEKVPPVGGAMAMDVLEKRFPGGQVFSAVIGDIVSEPVEAIVSAANPGLSLIGGVAAAIADAAGPELRSECNAIIASSMRVNPGESVVTTAGRLPFRGVIHAVGPRMGDGDEEQKIVKALKAAFTIAHERGWHSLSFPGISSGMNCVPPEICARAYLRAVAEFFTGFPQTHLQSIRLCLLLGPLFDSVRRTWKEMNFDSAS